MFTINDKKQTEPQKVKALPATIARKIAAGEVIDRPNAVLREFMDNAIDAHSDRILVEVDGGGIDCIRVVDNGWGMSKEDLEACARPHVTSKIQEEEDLNNLYTLGFRGEALASIAAVSKLQITSRRNTESWQLDAYLEDEHEVSPANIFEGTIAISKSLFENFPARRQFLKRPQSEGTLCKQIFIEKSLPFTDIAFRLTMDGKIKLDLPKNQTLVQRFTSVLDMKEKEPLFYTVKKESENWNIQVVLGEPSVYKNDRKNMYIFVNGRRVQEFAFLQALDYGAEGFFPNGTHPVACLFIDIDSSLVDFNIHPAKKEVRFKDISSVHHEVSSLVRNFYKDFSIKSLLSEEESEREHKEYTYPQTNLFNSYSEPSEKINSYTPNKNYSNNNNSNSNYTYEKKENPYSNNFSNPTIKNMYSEIKTAVHDTFTRNTDTPSSYNFKYLGRTLDVFLLVEKNNSLYLVDQHAGHERVRFEKIMKSYGQKQNLLIPLVIESMSIDEDKYLESITQNLEKAGFEIENCGDGRWEVHAVPIEWHGTEQDLQKDLLENRVEPKELLRNLAAMTACRGAVKDGHILDTITAMQLLEQIFALEDPHCPHGRPIWTVLSKDELFDRVRRTH